MSKIPYGYQKDKDGKVVAHRTWLKCTFNPFFRRIQFWTKRPYVIYSLSQGEVFLGYGIGRVFYDKKLVVEPCAPRMKEDPT